MPHISHTSVSVWFSNVHAAQFHAVRRFFFPCEVLPISITSISLSLPLVFFLYFRTTESHNVGGAFSFLSFALMIPALLNVSIDPDFPVESIIEPNKDFDLLWRSIAASRAASDEFCGLEDDEVPPPV